MRPLNTRTLVVLVVAASLLFPSAVSIAQGPTDFIADITTDMVMAHVSALSVDIGARPMGSEAEQAAADYIALQLEDWGYHVDVQEFETTPPSDDDTAETVTSRNVIGIKSGDDQIVVVGAHMDSVTAGTGAGDNASGVAVMLAAAQELAHVETTHTLMFVAFGAEEGGNPPGADVFVESLGDQIDNVIAMLNIDSVGVGTNLNVYAGAVVTWPDDDGAPTLDGGPTWVRDLALDLSAKLGLAFGTSPDSTWGGYTGDWSDHYAFVLAGVPIAYFEAWQWEPAEDIWWGQETAEGDVMHTSGDVYENVVPEKVEMTAELVTLTTFDIAIDDVTGDY